MSKAIQSFSRGVTVSLAIHSRIYGGQFRSRVPLAWQRAMKVTTCWSTSFTSRRSSSKFRRDSSRGRYANPGRFECDFAKRVRDFGSLSETARWRNWGERRGLNPRPSVPQTDALPAELRSPPPMFYWLFCVFRLLDVPTFVPRLERRRDGFCIFLNACASRFIACLDSFDTAFFFM